MSKKTVVFLSIAILIIGVFLGLVVSLASSALRKGSPERTVLEHVLGYSSPEASKHENGLLYRQVAAMVLAKHLSEKYPDSRILFVACPQSDNNHVIPSVFAGGFCMGVSKNMTVRIVQPIADASSRRKHFLDWYTPEVFRKTVEPYLEKTDIIVANALPVKVAQEGFQAILFGKKSPKLATLLTFIPRDVELFRNKNVLAAVCYHPGPDIDKDVASLDVPAKVFDDKYILITPENIDKVIRKHDLYREHFSKQKEKNKRESANSPVVESLL